MSTFRPGREQRRQRLATRRGRRARQPLLEEIRQGVLRYPVWLRRALAGALLVVLPVVGWLFARWNIAEGQADADAVATQPRHTAKLVDFREWGRSCPCYKVEYEGEVYELYNGYPLDETLGAPVQIVFRPDDPELAIGVSDPWSWEPDPAADRTVYTVMLLLGFGFALVGAWKLLPDDRAKSVLFGGPGDPGAQ